VETAYEVWRSGGGTAALAEVAAGGRDHWGDLARAMLELHAEQGAAAAEPIRALVECSHEGLALAGGICPRPSPSGQ
jgi:hypothetical protein